MLSEYPSSVVTTQNSSEIDISIKPKPSDRRNNTVQVAGRVSQEDKRRGRR
jgi:hypothetical protein